MSMTVGEIVKGAAGNVAARLEVEAEKLRQNPGNWQARWRAEQKALAAAKLVQAIEEVVP